MKTVFLIGATGHVGAHLMRELAADHARGALRVKVAARSAPAAAKVAAAGLEPVAFDLDEQAGFDAALAGADVIFLLRPYTIRQLMQGKQVIDAARRAGASAVVLLGAHGAPDTPHPMIGWNFLVEAYAERSGLAWTHLRPNFFMDNLLAQYDAAAGALRSGIAVPVSWVAGEDIAAVAAAVLRDPFGHAGRAYALAADRRAPVEIAAVIARLTGRPCEVLRPPRDLVLDRLLKQGRELVYAEPLLDYIDAINAGRVPEAADVTTAVEDVTGRPSVTIEAFLAKHLAARPAPRALGATR